MSKRKIWDYFIFSALPDLKTCFEAEKMTTTGKRQKTCTCSIELTVTKALPQLSTITVFLAKYNYSIDAGTQCDQTAVLINDYANTIKLPCKDNVKKEKTSSPFIWTNVRLSYDTLQPKTNINRYKIDFQGKSTPVTYLFISSVPHHTPSSMPDPTKICSWQSALLIFRVHASPQMYMYIINMQT
jgi:hypothetical protein